jgi:hypothetical protein
VNRFLTHLGARAIRASMLVDRALSRYDRLRSFLVTCAATDGVLDAYNDLVYGATKVYDASAPEFRERLFNWEAELVQRVFPPPPGRVLVGGAGGGRETFELISRGYAVAAFEPSDVLARSMADRAATSGHPVEVFLARYQDLPMLRRVGTDQVVDLRCGGRFDAAMLGWSSFSHIRHRHDRILTLQRFAEVTDGPVVASFFLRRDTNRPRHKLSQWAGRLGLRAHGDRFTPHIGFFHQSSADELEAEVADAGLVQVAVSYNDTDGYWPWIAVARPDVASATTIPAST